jgi:Family of unknown function (DUF6338)
VTLPSFDTVFFTLAFLVPGFIWDWTSRVVMPRGAETRESSLLRFLTLSAINYGFWVWLIYLLAKSPFFVDNPLRSGVAWALVIFVSPALFGLALGALGQRSSGRQLLHRLGISIIHPIPTAWDYFFSRTKPVWVLATLIDGSHVAGYFGAESFASSEHDARDIYLEGIYTLNDAGPWTENPRNAGGWIRGSEIRHLEFRAVENPGRRSDDNG